MKRAHRKTHLLMWLVLAPVMAATILLALAYRPDAPINEALPTELLTEAE